mgnify:FL=1
MINQHEHKEFIDEIMYKVKKHSRLVSMNDESTNLDQFKELMKEQKEVIEDIENSLYWKLDEIGDSR